MDWFIFLSCVSWWFGSKFQTKTIYNSNPEKDKTNLSDSIAYEDDEFAMPWSRWWTKEWSWSAYHRSSLKNRTLSRWVQPCPPSSARKWVPKNSGISNLRTPFKFFIYGTVENHVKRNNNSLYWIWIKWFLVNNIKSNSENIIWNKNGLCLKNM